MYPGVGTSWERRLLRGIFGEFTFNGVKICESRVFEVVEYKSGVRKHSGCTWGSARPGKYIFSRNIRSIWDGMCSKLISRVFKVSAYKYEVTNHRGCTLSGHFSTKGFFVSSKRKRLEIFQTNCKDFDETRRLQKVSSFYEIVTQLIWNNY